MFSSKRAHALAHGQQASLGSDTPMQPPRTPGRRPRLLAKQPARPGDPVGGPGRGSRGGPNLITASRFIRLWFVATNLHWIKPLFLPSPQAVYAKFIYVATEGFANSTLAQHTGISLLRVFGA